MQTDVSVVLFWVWFFFFFYRTLYIVLIYNCKSSRVALKITKEQKQRTHFCVIVLILIARLYCLCGLGRILSRAVK